MGNEKYLQFPLYLLRGLHTNREEAINDIIRYGIYRYSNNFEVQPQDIARQVIYDNYRGELTNEIKEKFNVIDSDYIGKDEDYNGFIGRSGFDPEDEISDLLQAFEADKELYQLSKEHYQIHLAYQSLGITGNKVNCIKVGKEIQKRIPTGEPMPMISKSLLFEFRDKEKAECEITQLCAFVAIKSILGAKSFVKTNKIHIVSRMFGYASIKHLPDKLPTNIKQLFAKYSNRYHIDRVLQRLELDWNVITYSNNIRGMYVAMSNKISIEQLALVAETKKQTNRIEALKKQKKEAKEKALQQLNKGQQLK